MKSKVKESLFFGIVIAILLSSINLYTCDIINKKEIIRAVLSGLTAGAIIGYVWYWLKGKTPI